jgi:hypothetical protein
MYRRTRPFRHPRDKYDWENTCYRGAKEEVPDDAPPRGKRVFTAFVDANLYHDLISGSRLQESYTVPIRPLLISFQVAVYR